MRFQQRPRGDAFQRFRFAAGRKPEPAAGTELQPVLHDPIAAWACLDEDTGTSSSMTAAVNVDRVSGAYPLTRPVGTVLPSPDLIKKYRCPLGGGSAYPLGRDNSAGGGADAALKLSGELTLSMRLWWSGMTDDPYPAVFDCSEAWPVRNGANGILQCFYRLFIDINAAGGPKLGCYHQRALGGYSYTDVQWNSAFTLLPGKWTYVAMRRTTLGAYTLNVDDQQQTGPNASAMPNPAFGQAASLNIGQWGSSRLASTGSMYGGSNPWRGGYADLMLWNKRLTDAQVLHQRAVMFDVEA